ncbi:hypothetical protein [Streptomyces sp. SP18CS02]|uniref:hypothetical protein n=1 Tax=Streptomyces sp. SP18CS02 TaxID=3002531 RepID=UPI003FCE8126
MAAPHVTGAAALHLSQHPRSGPAEVAEGLAAAATPGFVTGPGSGSPNPLLYAGDGTTPPRGRPSPASAAGVPYVLTVHASYRLRLGGEEDVQDSVADLRPRVAPGVACRCDPYGTGTPPEGAGLGP